MYLYTPTRTHTHTHTHYVWLPGDKLTIPVVRQFSSLLGLQYRNHSQARNWGGKETSDTTSSPHSSRSWTGPWGSRVRESACPWVSIRKPSMRGNHKAFFLSQENVSQGYSICCSNKSVRLFQVFLLESQQVDGPELRTCECHLFSVSSSWESSLNWSAAISRDSSGGPSHPCHWGEPPYQRQYTLSYYLHSEHDSVLWK